MNTRRISRRQCLAQAAALSAGALAQPLFALTASHMLERLRSPVLFRGSADVAYRDPAALYHQGFFYLYFTLLRKAPNGLRYSYVAWSRSRDLQQWSAPVTLTPPDKHLDFGSPGNIVWSGSEWVMCLQSYPRPNGEHYGNQDARLWIMRSTDLRLWSQPELLRVKGCDIAIKEMGRMIDPFLLKDKDDPTTWWCFYKQDGISLSRSNDLRTWTYVRHIDAGENPCVIVDHNEYLLLHSPENGIGFKRSTDLITWRDDGITTLGQSAWAWARGRITAGFLLDLRNDPSIGKALLFFHGSRYPDSDPQHFDNFASIGIAWSDDLKHWRWPGSP